MFSHGTLSQYSKSNAAVWLSLAFQAGTINAGGFLACHKFVSHVTGFGTLLATEAAQGRFETSLGFLSVPGFFMLGVMISAFLVDRRIQRNEKPLYPVIMALILILMLGVTLAGSLGHLGTFGTPSSLAVDYALLAALCLACGIQNATITSAFGAIVRTTHLTGITTDLGIGIIRVFSRSHKFQSRSNEINANWMRFGLILFFTLGSFVSAYVYIHAQYWGFLIPAGIANILLIWSLITPHNSEAGKTT